MSTKICTGCKKELSLTSFHKAKSNKFGVNNLCKTCRSEKSSSDYRENWFRKFFLLKRNWCKINNVPFNLTEDYLKSIWTETCPVFNKSFVRFDKSNDMSPALDRLIPSIGYVQGNVVFISARANRIKYDTSPEELKKLLEWFEGVTTISKESTPKRVETTG